MKKLFLLTLSCSALVACSSEPEIVVTRQETGEAWPYPNADRAIIRCHDRNHVTIEINGTKYGLDGRAQSDGYPPSQQQMDADEYGIIMNLGPDDWVDKGLALCNPGVWD